MLEFSTASYWKNEGVYAELIVKYNSNPGECVCVCIIMIWIKRVAHRDPIPLHIMYKGSCKKCTRPLQYIFSNNVIEIQNGFLLCTFGLPQPLLPLLNQIQKFTSPDWLK